MQKEKLLQTDFVRQLRYEQFARDIIMKLNDKERNHLLGQKDFIRNERFGETDQIKEIRRLCRKLSLKDIILLKKSIRNQLRHFQYQNLMNYLINKQKLFSSDIQFLDWINNLKNETTNLLIIQTFLKYFLNDQTQRVYFLKQYNKVTENSNQIPFFQKKDVYPEMVKYMLDNQKEAKSIQEFANECENNMFLKFNQCIKCDQDALEFYQECTQQIFKYDQIIELTKIILAQVPKIESENQLYQWSQEQLAIQMEDNQIQLQQDFLQQFDSQKKEQIVQFISDAFEYYKRIDENFYQDFKTQFEIDKIQANQILIQVQKQPQFQPKVEKQKGLLKYIKTKQEASNFFQFYCKE